MEQSEIPTDFPKLEQATPVVTQNVPPQQPEPRRSLDPRSMMELEMIRLQNAFAKYRQANMSEGYLLDEVHRKLTELWEDGEENLGYRLRVEDLERKTVAMRKQIRVLKLKLANRKTCRSCAGLKRERDQHAKKCRNYKSRVAQVEKASAAKDKLLKEAQLEIKRLNWLTPCSKQHGASEVERKDPCTLVANVKLTDNLEAMETVIIHVEDMSASLNDFLEVKMGSDEHQDQEVRSEQQSNFSLADKTTTKDPASEPGPSTSTDAQPQMDSITINGNPFENLVPRKFECTFEGCGRIFSTKTNLNRHAITHTGKKSFVCNFKGCSLSFFRKEYLNSHYLTHTGEKPFPCRECGRCFKTKYSLNYHMPTHSEKKPYRCTIDDCERGFSRQKTLDEHILLHVGVQPFECNHEGCNRKFYRKSTYKHHLDWHAGLKVFECTVVGCGRKFDRRSNLKQHLLCHMGHRPFECMYEGCGRKFSLQTNLTRHALIHTGKKLFKCNFEGCDRSYSRNEQLKIHILKHAQENV